MAFKAAIRCPLVFERLHWDELLARVLDHLHHYGIGWGKLGWIKNAWDMPRLKAWRACELARDPHGLLNPEKLCPWDESRSTPTAAR